MELQKFNTTKKVIFNVKIFLWYYVDISFE